MKKYSTLINQIKRSRLEDEIQSDENSHSQYLEEPLEESWKTIGAVALVLRIKGINQKISNIKFKSDSESTEALFMKLDLLAQLNTNLSYLIAQQGLSK
jgi:hypothetical protein